MAATGVASSNRGAKVKKVDPSLAGQIIGRIITFIRMFVPGMVAKRIIGSVLLAVGLTDERVSELTGMSGRSVRELRKKLRDGASDNDLFGASGGGGRGRKLEDVEKFVIGKIESNDYHTHQEIADMIYDEYGIKVHRSTVLRMLKKRQ